MMTKDNYLKMDILGYHILINLHNNFVEHRQFILTAILFTIVFSKL